MAIAVWASRAARPPAWPGPAVPRGRPVRTPAGSPPVVRDLDGVPVATTVACTVWSRWLGGPIESGESDTERLGGVVSSTVTVCIACVRCPIRPSPST
jgi:hypothetical protein